MARVFITRSSDGLGLMAAKLLIDEGHEVVLHGRNDARLYHSNRGASASPPVCPSCGGPPRVFPR